MSLFSLDDIKSKATAKSGALVVSSETGMAMLDSVDDVENAINALEKGKAIDFVSKGRWSMHEMLEFMLRKAGPSDVYFTTWTITEDPIRRLFMLKEEGLIKSLACILDYRIKDRKPAPFQLLQNIADQHVLTQCHAKVTIVIGEELAYTCLSSANFSKNPRIEAGIIGEGRMRAAFHRDWILKEIADGDTD